MKKILKAVTATTALFALVACSSSDVYDAAAVEKKQKEDYAANFIKKYGDISNQTWDFTTGAELAITRGVTEITTQIVDGIDFGMTDGKVTKNQAVIDALKKLLPEKKVHTGQQAVLVAPSSSFTIYPISVQGACTHTFYVKVGNNEPIAVYHKDYTDWSKPYYNGTQKLNENNKAYTGEDKTVYMPGITIQAPVGTPIEVYVGDNDYRGRLMPSCGTTNGQAILLDTDVRPEGIELRDDAVIKYIGIEDIPVGTTNPPCDRDYNDAVFMLVGNPDVPEEVIITNEEYDVRTGETKRYMIEDLGATDDFDFNDIVVDVTEYITYRHRVTSENGVKTSDEVISSTKEQDAVIRHLGGTLPFTLKIGNTTLPTLDGQLDVDTELRYEIEGWIPSQNNISIGVQQLNSSAVSTIGFPKKGEAPMIIAVPSSWNWMGERVSIPSSWFTTVE